ncbi:uncharacterized protein LOC134252602 [Saccostrea cucullata]|uniref:uncharacterized protein LOC134252602 n=1 Tax=Saccostrea cuccullata TaxID=36930 RepID=UPI002ED1F2C3
MASDCGVVIPCSKNSRVKILVYLAFFVLTILCMTKTVQGNHVPQPVPGTNANRGRIIRPDALSASQRRRGSQQQQQTVSRGTNSNSNIRNGRRFSMQNARASTQKRNPTSRRTERLSTTNSRSRGVGNSRLPSRQGRRRLNVRRISNQVSSRGRLQSGSDPNGRVQPMPNADANRQLNDRGNTDLFPSSINQFINRLRERIPNIGLGLGVHIQDPEGTSRSGSANSGSASGMGSVRNVIGSLGGLFNRGRNSAPSIPTSQSSSHSRSSSGGDFSLGSNVRGQVSITDPPVNVPWQRPSPPSSSQQSQILVSNQSPVQGSAVPVVQDNRRLLNSGFIHGQPVNIQGQGSPPLSLNTNLQQQHSPNVVNPISQPVMQQQNNVQQPTFGFPQRPIVNQQQIPPTFSLSLQQQQRQLQHQQITRNQNTFNLQGQVQPQQVASIMQPVQQPLMQSLPQQSRPVSLFGQAPQTIQNVQQQPFQLRGRQNVFMQQQSQPTSGSGFQQMQMPILQNQQSIGVGMPVLPTPAPIMSQAIQTNGQTIINGAGNIFQAPAVQTSFNAQPSLTPMLTGQQNVGVQGQFVNVQGQILQLQPASQNTYQIVNGQLVPVQQTFQLVPTGQTMAPRQQPAQMPIQPGSIQMAAFETNTASGVRKTQNLQAPTKVPFSFGLFSSSSSKNAKISNLTSQAKQLVEQNAQIELQNQLLQQMLIEQVLNGQGLNSTGFSPKSSNSSTSSAANTVSNKAKVQPAAVAFNWREGTAVTPSNSGIRRVMHGQENPGGVKVISLRAANTISPFNRTKGGITLAPPMSHGIKSPTVNAAKPTFDPEVLPQYRNSTNDTLRSMDRTDRLNTTDIPEEIEVNGMSLDSPADRNGVGTPHPLDSYVHGVHGHNNMGTRPVTPATVYGTRKSEKLSKLGRSDRVNTTDVPEEIEVNGQSLDSPADRNGMNIYHPMDYLVHGVTPGPNQRVHAIHQNAHMGQPAPPEEPEERIYSASDPGYIDTTIGFGTNVMDLKHFRDPTLFEAVSHQAYELMNLLQFSLSRIPSKVLHGVQYWMPNIPYNVFRSIKNSAPSFYQGFKETVGSIPTSVVRGILNLVDIIRFSSAKTNKPVKNVAAKIAQVLHDSFTSPKPPTTPNLYDFRIFDMIQLTTTQALPATTDSPVRHSAKTLAKLMNLVKLLIHEPSTTTTTTNAPPSTMATEALNVIKTNGTQTVKQNTTSDKSKINTQVSIKAVSGQVAKSSSVSVSVEKVTPKPKLSPITKNIIRRLPPTPAPRRQNDAKLGRQRQQQRPKTKEKQQRVEKQLQNQPRSPKPIQNSPEKARSYPTIQRQNRIENNRQVQINFSRQSPPKQAPQHQKKVKQSSTITTHGVFEIQNKVPSSSKKSKLDLMGVHVKSSKPKITTDLPTQLPPKTIPPVHSLPTQVPPDVYPIDSNKGFRHERIATPPVYHHQPIPTQPYMNRRPQPSQRQYPTMPRYQQPITTTPPNVMSSAPPSFYNHYEQPQQQHQQQIYQQPQQHQQQMYQQPQQQPNSPDYLNNFFGDGPTQPSPTEAFGNAFGYNAQSQNFVREPIENTIQYKEFSNANRKGFRISEVFGRKK